MTVQEKYLKIVDEVIEKGPYKPDWVSLSGYETPKWFKDAKFGYKGFIPMFTAEKFNPEEWIKLFGY